MRVQRSLREMNAQTASVEDRYDSISIKARSSNVVHISIAFGRRGLCSLLYTPLQASCPMPFPLSCRSNTAGQHCLSASSDAVINDSSHSLFFARFAILVVYYEKRRDEKTWIITVFVDLKKYPLYTSIDKASKVILSNQKTLSNITSMPVRSK